MHLEISFFPRAIARSEAPAVCTKQTYCLNPQHFLWPGSFLEQRFLPPCCRRLPKRCYRNHVCSFLCDCAVGPRHRPGSRRNRSLSRSGGLLQPAAGAPHEQGHRLSPGAHRVLPGGAGWTPVPGLGRGSRRSITQQSCCSGSGWARGAGNTCSPPGQHGLHPREVPTFSLELHLPQSTFS